MTNVETERSQEASACRRFYDITLEQVLRDFEWPFATKFQALGLIEEDPTTEWQYSYQYPSDCLMARRILSGIRNDDRQSQVPYRLVNNGNTPIIYTDQEDAELEYTVRATDPQVYPPDFTLALSFLLAYYIAPRITGGDPFKRGEAARAEYLASISSAKASAENEEQQEEQPDSEFMRVRD